MSTLHSTAADPALVPHAAPRVIPSSILLRLEFARPRRVLVVDDEHLVIASLQQSLRAIGCEPVGPARDGAHAIQVAFYTQPDLAVMDIRMAAEQDGIDAAAALYAQMAIPVVIVSAYSGKEQTMAASRAGVFGFLVKPAGTDQLRAAIDVAWGRYLQTLRAENANTSLHRQLEERLLVERAKWRLVERETLTEGEAIDRLRTRSQDEHRPLVEIARDVLDG